MTEPTYTKEQIEQAHMAGQADAGVDPSYSNAQAYVQELTRPAHQFREGEVIARGDAEGHGLLFYRYMEGGTTLHARPLRLSEMPAAVSELRKSIEFALSYSEDAETNPDCGIDIFWSIYNHQKNALAAFDKAIGEE